MRSRRKVASLSCLYMKKRTNKKKDTSQFVAQREKIDKPLNVREFPWTKKQQDFIQLVQDKNTKVVFVDAPAGVGKTLLAVYAGLKLLEEKKVSELFYVRTLAESASKGMGFLPGEAKDKFGPFMGPLLD